MSILATALFVVSLSNMLVVCVYQRRTIRKLITERDAAKRWADTWRDLARETQMDKRIANLDRDDAMIEIARLEEINQELTVHLLTLGLKAMKLYMS